MGQAKYVGSESDHSFDAESRLANELVETRRAFVAAIHALPDELQAVALGDDRTTVTEQDCWPIADMRAAWERLHDREQSTADTTLTLRVHRLGATMRRIERLRDRMVERNLRLVAHLVKQLGTNPQVPYMDLVQEGSLGLMRAVDRYDPQLGHRFSTYAYWWIRQSVFKALDDKSRMIRLPGHVINSRRVLRKLEQQFLEEFGREPTADEVAETLQISPRKARALLTVVAEPLPLDDAGPEDSDRELGDIVADDEPSPLDRVLDSELHDRLQSAMGVLTERERSIVRLRYGIDHATGHTLREIGEMFALTRERVRQIELRALAKLGEAEREAFGRPAALIA